jgi:hypothetical protein
MTSLFGTLKLDSEPPARRELGIAVVTIYAIVVAILTCEIVNQVRSTETQTTSPYNSRLRTHNV